MSVINKIPRGLRVLIVMVILAALVWQFARDTIFYPGAIGASILITLGVIFAVYRKTGVIAESPDKNIKVKKPGSLNDGESESAAPENSLGMANIATDNISIEADYTDIPSTQRRGKPVEPFKSVTQKPKAADVVANYLKMAKTTNENETDSSYSLNTVPKTTQPEDEESSIQGPVNEQSENQADDSTNKPPIPLAEDESKLTQDEKNELVNAVWCRCENPYCKFTNFLTIHHIIDEKDGGTNKLDNLIVLCPYCHDLAHRNEIPEKEMRSWISKNEKRFKSKPEWHYF